MGRVIDPIRRERRRRHVEEQGHCLRGLLGSQGALGSRLREAVPQWGGRVGAESADGSHSTPLNVKTLIIDGSHVIDLMGEDGTEADL